MKMNKKFAQRLTEYLDHECDDYDLKYNWEFSEDMGCCSVTVSRMDKEKQISFKHNEKTDCLLIELSEDSFYETEEFNPSVKYFWMLIAPTLFSNN